MNWKSIVLLLRFPFSFFLLPVFLYSFWYSGIHSDPIFSYRALWCFFILHFLVYPASNGYNSLQDKDEGPIGGLKSPPVPPKELKWIVAILDITALLLGYTMVHPIFCVGLLGYILASRAYSNRTIRLKQYPTIGFLVVFLFQGAWLFLMCLPAFGFGQIDWMDLFAALGASCLIGAMYPLTQVYQHRADEADDVNTLSMKLGIKGTFYFSTICFILGMAILGWFSFQNDLGLHFWILQLGLFPSLIFFFRWFLLVKNRPEKADFENTMRMNLLSSSGLALAFIVNLLLLSTC